MKSKIQRDTSWHMFGFISIKILKSYLGQKISHPQKKEKQVRIHLPLHLLRTGDEIAIYRHDKNHLRSSSSEAAKSYFRQNKGMFRNAIT